MVHRKMVDINLEAFDQLNTLAGIGATYARMIMQGRPYQRTDELVMKQVILQRSYERIKEHIMTRPK